MYEKSPADFKQAKLYLDLNEDFSPDNIVAKAQIYLSKNGFYADSRHSFKSFINNIGSFVDEMPGKYRTQEKAVEPHRANFASAIKHLYTCHEHGEHTEKHCPKCSAVTE